MSRIDVSIPTAAKTPNPINIPITIVRVMTMFLTTRMLRVPITIDRDHFVDHLIINLLIIILTLQTNKFHKDH